MMWIEGSDWHFWGPLVLLGAIALALEIIREQLSDIDSTLARLVDEQLIDQEPVDLADDWKRTQRVVPVANEASQLFS